MKKAKGEEGFSSTDRISDLPEEILQRILYFMSQKEVVRTSILSKPWRHIWCSRPNLDFSDAAFKGNIRKFLSTVDENLRRYCDQGLCLEEFRLSTSLGDYLYHESVSHLERWIPTLTNIGVKEFRLFIYSRNSPRQGRVKLPHVVFESESLQDLHVERMVLDRKTLGRAVLPMHLKKLHLDDVNIDDGLLQKIISSCPLIETLFLISCNRLSKINANNLRHLKNFSFSSNQIPSPSNEEDCRIEIYPPSIETITIKYGIILFQKGADFHNLNNIFMRYVLLPLDHFSSCKFPSLKNLTLLFCDGLEESMEESELFIDAPNINTFIYHGFLIPISISFPKASGKWSSTLYLISEGAPSSWLLKLHKLLKSLSQSEISLTIHQDQMSDKDMFQEDLDLVQDIKENCGNNNPAVVLEKLILQQLRYFSPLSNGLFCICRPRNIGDVYFMNYESVMKNLMRRESENQHQLRQLWLPDLEEVRLEVYDDVREEWHPTSLSDLPDYELGQYSKTRFALKWRENL